MRSRWDTSARKDERGKPVPLVFGRDDFEVCKLFAPVQGIREPWSYQYLPSSYVAPLLGRGPIYFTNRLQQLACEPHCYLAQPDQPQQNFRSIIYSIGSGGIDELKDAGHVLPRKALRLLPHELMACICAASFEYASLMRKGVTVEAEEDEKRDFYADRDTFRVTTPHHSKRVYLEADTGSEQFERHPNNTTIYDKLEQYLSLRDELRDAMVLFVTTRLSRRDKMIECLKAVIDAKRLPHGYARSFGFTYINYDRFLTKIPKLTDWAVSGDYARAGSLGAFNFLKK